MKKQTEKKLFASEIQLNNYKNEALKNLSENADNLASVIIKKIFTGNLEDKKIAELINSKKD